MKKQKIHQNKNSLNKPVNKKPYIASGRESEFWDPRTLFNSFTPNLFHWDRHWPEPFRESNGVSVSEDDKRIYIEAALPGIPTEEINISVDRGILTIHANQKEETSDKKKTFYQKAHKSFFYQITIPGAFDESKQPEAVYKNGILTITFLKTDARIAKKNIPVKKG